MDIRGQIVFIHILPIAPCDSADFVGRIQFRRRGPKREDQVVMKMERLAAAGRNAVHVDSDQARTRGRLEMGSGFLDHFTTRGVPDFGIVGFDMAARQEPSLQPSVEDNEKRVAFRMQNKSGARHMTGHELRAREWRRRVREQLHYEFAAFFVFAEFRHEFLKLSRVDQTLFPKSTAIWVEGSAKRDASSTAY